MIAIYTTKIQYPYILALHNWLQAIISQSHRLEEGRIRRADLIVHLVNPLRNRLYLDGRKAMLCREVYISG